MFYNCVKLEKIFIPYNIKMITDGAFMFCQSLTKINIPKNVEFIDKNVFSYCDKLVEINVDEDNKNYFSIDGKLYSKDKKEIIRCVSFDEIYEIAEGAKIIGENSFAVNKIKEVIIQNSVNKICDFAFSHCESLKSIKISKNVKKVGKYAFYKCKELTVNCNMKQIPKGWHFDWDKINYPDSEEKVVVKFV